jgi:hypothetical protein
MFFFKDAALDEKAVHQICTNLQLCNGKFHQCRSVLAALRCLTSSNGIHAVIDAQQIQKELHQQPWLA